MINLVTLAYRISRMHTDYSGIHACIFPFPLARLKRKLLRKREATPCECGMKLTELHNQLVGTEQLILKEEDVELKTSRDRDFAGELVDYIRALDATVNLLNGICNKRCMERKGEYGYDPDESRQDMIDYDISIQHYQRLGERLNLLIRKHQM